MVVNNFKWMYKKWGIRGMTLGKNLIVYYNSPKERDSVIENHEKIHQAQIKEIGSYWKTLWIYYGEFFKLKKHGYDSRTANRLISLEQEAYDNADNLNYLKTREAFAWKRYL